MVEIIVEVATNHGGDPDLAREFIDRFIEAGADTIKFQYYECVDLRLGDPQAEWFDRAFLSQYELIRLAEYTRAQGKQFLCTVYNARRLDIIDHLKLTRIKIGSGEAHEGSIAHALQTGYPSVAPIVSEGLRPIHGYYRYSHCQVLGCVSRYPAPCGMAGLKMQNPLYVGWSDHSGGLEECGVAIALGAEILEVHGCLLRQARPIRSFEKPPEDVKELRRMADENPFRFLGRWQR